MNMPIPLDRTAQVRRFNRFYTRQLGLLDEHFLESPYTLAECRVLYELGTCETTTASAVIAALGLDAGYLSRILRRFQAAGLVGRRRDPGDRRQYRLWLTDAGRAVFDGLEARSQAEASAMLAQLPPAEQDRVVGAMAAILARLQDAPVREIALRPHRTGDMGWITWRQAVIYAESYGWNAEFEALLCDICRRFLAAFDPARERGWIAERDGEILGSIFLARETDTVARLRLFYVELAARGQGLGRRLVDECVAFARARGYRRIVLWTYDMLASARRIYQAAGFELVEQVEEERFGHRMRSQSWALDLEQR